jgi:hypothetical protein
MIVLLQQWLAKLGSLNEPFNEVARYNLVEVQAHHNACDPQTHIQAIYDRFHCHPHFLTLFGARERRPDGLPTR